MIRIAICDDDASCREQMQALILRHTAAIAPEISTFCDSSALITAILEDNYLPDIAVLDIIMPDDNGIELAKRLNRICRGCSIIFVSSHLSFATEVYETQHSYFVLKSQAHEKIGPALKKALDERARREYMIIRCDRVEHHLPVDEVLFLERRLKKTLVMLISGDEYLVSAKPDELVSQLNSSPFIRCHQSFWANLNFIKSMDSDYFLLTTGQKIPISRSHRAEAKSAFHSALCHAVMSHEL